MLTSLRCEIRLLTCEKITNVVVYPAAGMLVMALEAAKQLIDESREVTGYVFKDVVFSSPLTLSQESEGVEVEVFLRPLRDGSEKNALKFDFKICAYINDRWHENCRGTIKAEYAAPKSEVDGGKEAAFKSSYYSQLYSRAQQSCNGKVDARSMYDYMQNAGLAYGPTFRVLDDLSYNQSGEAIGTLKAFGQQFYEQDDGYRQFHTIHPTTLDGLLQIMLVGLSRGKEDNAPTMVPRRINRLWISQEGISHPQTAAVNAYARAAFSSRRTASALLLAFHKTTSNLLLSIDYSEATIVATRDSMPTTAVNDGKKMCYNMTWKPDVELLDSQQLQIHCEGVRAHRPSSAKFHKVLDLVIRTFAWQAVEALYQCKNRPNEAHLLQYIQWLKDQTARTDSQDQTMIQDPQQWNAICSYVSYSSLGKFYLKVGRSLLKILQGDVNSRTFLTQDDLLLGFYERVNRETICYGPWQEYMRLLYHKRSRLKILEIGAEGGAMTDFVRQILVGVGAEHEKAYGCVEYDYTETSPELLNLASRRFQGYSDKIKFRLLKLGDSISSQGFEPETYDLIVAANSLRFSHDLNKVIQHARALLKPTGKLVLLEITDNGMRTDFVLGLLPEWRLESSLSAKEWDSLLSRNGFSGVELEIADSLESGCHQHSILVTTRNELVETLPVSPLADSLFSKVLVIVSDEADATQYMIADHLQNRLTAFSMCEDCSIIKLTQASTVSDLAGRCSIALVELTAPMLSHMSKAQFEQVRYLLTNVPRILWVTNGGGAGSQDPRYCLIDGLARVARTEFNQATYITLALEKVSSSVEAVVDNIVRVAEINLLQPATDGSEPEYVEANGVLQISRITRANYLDNAVQVRTSSKQIKMQTFGSASALALQVGSPGLLDTLYFSEDSTASQSLAPGELEIKVESAGVNFRDCLTALGQINAISLGSECSGTVTRVGPGCQLAQPGDRVSACFANTFKTLARGPEACTIQIPKDMSFIDASAIPVIFVTAWHALCDLAKLQAGESVLIHAAAGGTGQAAIQIAKLVGAVIYVTVGSEEKKHLLMSEYDLSEYHILYSRDTSFAEGIMRLTNGQGVDVVLNSLSGENLIASWECIAEVGHPNI